MGRRIHKRYRLRQRQRFKPIRTVGAATASLYALYARTNGSIHCRTLRRAG